MRRRLLALTLGAAATLLAFGAVAANAAGYVNNFTTGYYNSGIGTSLDGTNPGPPQLFPLANLASGDPTFSITAPEPNLSAAAGALGTWLTTSPPSGGSWSSGPISIPPVWAVNTETAIVYAIDAGTGSIQNLLARFGVDNGVYVWLDGVFKFGALAPGGAFAFEYNVALGTVGPGVHYLQILREDHGGATGWTVSVTGDPVLNKPPTVTANGPYQVDEGGAVTLTASGSDPDADTLSYAWDLDDNGSFETPGQSVAFSAAGLDGPSLRNVRVQASDGKGGLAADGAGVFKFGALAPGGAFAFEYNVALRTVGPGVYTVGVTVTDDDGGSASATFQYVVVYSGEGFVTGGGWIDSPAGAYVPDPSLTGRATFGFVSKYLPGRTTPSGSTEFHFRAASFAFRSTSYEWLVVSGFKAQYRGTGAINGGGSYAFLLTVYDGDRPGGDGVDRFRLKVTDVASGNVVYDNALGASDDLEAADPQALGQGSVVIHRG